MLSAQSKVAGVKAATGAIQWERSAIGHIGDIFSIGRKGQTNVGFVIDSTDTKKTRIAEYPRLYR